MVGSSPASLKKFYLNIITRDSKGKARRPKGGLAAMEGGGRALPRPGELRQDVEAWRGVPRLSNTLIENSSLGITGSKFKQSNGYFTYLFFVSL